MRHALICALLVLLPARVALGQEWVEFTSVEDGFRIAFPLQPQVQNTTYTTQYRLHAAGQGIQRHIRAAAFRGHRRGLSHHPAASHRPDLPEGTRHLPAPGADGRDR